MTRAEKYDILRTIENDIEREKRLCDEYARINPNDNKRRERDRDNIIYGLQLAWLHISEKIKIN